MKGDIVLKINKKIGAASLALIGIFAMADYVTLINSSSAGGIIVKDETIIDTTPVGSVMMWGGATPPSGWIEMNGQSTGSDTELANIYGSNVPDLRGEFVRGWDNGRGKDSGRSIKTEQNQSVQALAFSGNALPGHRHSSDHDGITTYSHSHDGNIDGSTTVTGYDRSSVSRPTTSYVSAGTPTGTINGTGIETRPTNIALMYIVKAQLNN